MNITFTTCSNLNCLRCTYHFKAFLLIVVVFISSGIGIANLKAQPIKQWDKTIGGNSLDELRSVQQTTDGGYILGGISQSLTSGDKSEDSGFSFYGDYWIVKLNAAGGKEWDNTLGGVGTNDFTAVYQAADGGYIVGGRSLSNAGRDKTQDSKGINDYWIIKLDANGNKIWDKTIGGPWDDLLWTLKPTKDGGVVLGGESQGGPGGDKTQAPKGGYDFWVVKLDAQGYKQWDKTIGGSGYDILRSIDLTSDGGYILGGLSASEASGDKTENSKAAGSTEPLAGYDYWVVKLNASGTKEWDKTIGGNALDDFRSLIQTKDGGYILAGESFSNISGDKSENSKGGRDYWVVKLNASGVKEWDKTFGGLRDEYINNIHQTIDGGSALVGTLNSLIKLNSTGNIEWEKAINGGGSFKSLDQTADGGYILGTTASGNAAGDKSEDSRGGLDYWVVKLSNSVNPERTISTINLDSPSFCVGNTLSVSYTTNGIFNNGEIFKVQLSNNSGSFVSPVVIGSGTTSPIAATIPSNTLMGTNYRIRVVSSSTPVVTGRDNGNNLIISTYTSSPPLSIYSSSTSCVGSTAIFSIRQPSGYTDFIWTVPSGWSIISGQGTNSIKVSVVKSNGYVAVTATNTCGVKNNTQAYIEPSIILNQPDEIKASTIFVCAGDTVVYSTYLNEATINDTYYWQLPPGWTIIRYGYNGTNTIYVKVGAESGTISASVFNQCGTSPPRKLYVTNYSPPPPIVTSASRCGPGPVTLTVSGGYLYGYYSWYTSSTSTTPIFSATGTTYTTPSLATTTTYYVSVADGTCESVRVPVTATINPVPVVLAKASLLTIPVGGSTTISATGANSYVWSGTNFGGATGATITVSPTITTTYQVTGTNAYGCSNTTSITITVKQNQLITFPSIGNKVNGDAPFPLTATSSSGLPVSYSIIAGPATLSGNMLTLTGDGTVTVRAMQTGNTTYLAATPVDQSFTVSPALTCTATGTILREQWNNVAGTSVSVIPITTTPTSTSQLTSFEAPSNIGSSYGARIRGYICAPQTGAYTFWVAGDNDCELWLSTDDNPANKVKIAGLVGYTAVRQWNKYPSQKSGLINLVANKRYYVEVLHKENSNGDNVAVAWQLPTGLMEAPIAGTRLSPFVPVVPPPACTATGTILREQWNNIAGTGIAAIPLSTPPTSTSQLTLFEGPTNIAANYGSRVRGYICAPQTGNYTFWVAGDDHVELWLSTDQNPVNKKKIANVTGWTNPREFTKYLSQKSAPIPLEAGRRYYIEALHKEGSGGDNLAVAWQLPNGLLEAPITGTRLSPFIVSATPQLVSAAKPESVAATIKDAPVVLKASPNPFSKVTTIQFSLPAPYMATLQVYNLNGRLLQTLHRGAVEKDRLYSYELSGDSLASGLYLCRLVYGNHSRYERLVVIK